MLNEDLTGEHQAIVHYLTHTWTVAHAVVAMGGTPDLTPPDLLPVLSGVEALIYDIDAEQQAIQQYLAHQWGIDNMRVHKLLARIIADEKDHRRQFRDMRDHWGDESVIVSLRQRG